MTEKPDTFLVGDGSYEHYQDGGFRSSEPVAEVEVPWAGWCPYWPTQAIVEAKHAAAGKTWRAREALFTRFLLKFMRDWAGVAVEFTTFENRLMNAMMIGMVQDNDLRYVLNTIQAMKALAGSRLGARSFTWRASPDCTMTCRAFDGMKISASDILNRGILSTRIGGHGCRCDIIPNLTWESPSTTQLLRDVAINVNPLAITRYSDECVDNAPWFWKPYIDRVTARYPDIHWRFVRDAYDDNDVAMAHSGQPLFGAAVYAFAGTGIMISDYAAEFIPLDILMLRAAFHRGYRETRVAAPHLNMAPTEILQVAPHLLESLNGCYRASQSLLLEIGRDGYREEAVACGIGDPYLETLLAGGSIGETEPPPTDLFELAFSEERKAFDAALLRVDP